LIDTPSLFLTPSIYQIEMSRLKRPQRLKKDSPWKFKQIPKKQNVIVSDTSDLPEKVDDETMLLDGVENDEGAISFPASANAQHLKLFPEMETSIESIRFVVMNNTTISYTNRDEDHVDENYIKFFKLFLYLVLKNFLKVFFFFFNKSINLLSIKIQFFYVLVILRIRIF